MEGGTVPIGKVRVFSLGEPENQRLTFCISEAPCFRQGCEWGAEGALLCRQKSAVGQTRLWSAKESRGNAGGHREAGVISSHLLQRAVRVSLTFTQMGREMGKGTLVLGDISSRAPISAPFLPVPTLPGSWAFLSRLLLEDEQGATNIHSSVST